MAPGPSISASVKVSLASICTDGEIFHPWPSSRAACAPVPSVAMPPLPFSPVKFSGLIERVLAFDSRESVPIPRPRPLDGGFWASTGPNRSAVMPSASSSLCVLRVLLMADPSSRTN